MKSADRGGDVDDRPGLRGGEFCTICPFFANFSNFRNFPEVPSFQSQTGAKGIAVLPLFPIFRQFFHFHKNHSSSVISGTFSRENRFPPKPKIRPKIAKHTKHEPLPKRDAISLKFP
jgi:hypothetical protein